MNAELISLLIVEDDLFIRNLLLEVLGQDYACTTVATLNEAVRCVRSKAFDVILLDEHLPDGSGLTLLAVVQTISPDTVVLVMSGKADEDSICEAKRRGAFDYLCKPFDLADLRKVVSVAVAEKVMTAA